MDVKRKRSNLIVTILSMIGLFVLTFGGANSAMAKSADSHSKPVKSSITVQKVTGITKNTIRGVDISTLISEEQSGVKYYNSKGKQQNLIKILKKSGVNYVRIRVWNDPYNSDGQGYGAGNSDLAKAIQIGKLATKNHMKVLIDFHYSDFWADPGKQTPPKAWADYTVDQKIDAVYRFTMKSMEKLKKAKVDVGMVQIGNETNGFFIGERNWTNICRLFNAGSKAVRQVSPKSLVVLHFTNPEKAGNYSYIAKTLNANNVDYDVFASSYYPYWHGTTSNLTAVLKNVATTYNKKVMVAETSYPYTTADGDGTVNVVTGKGSDFNFPTSPQGQATSIRNIFQAVADVGPAGLGVFYWEPAWIPVGTPDRLAQNQDLWLKYGSGWASSYAQDYESDTATEWGGSQWDNQALFDFSGKALPSLNVFNYIFTGSTSPKEVWKIQNDTLTFNAGEPISLPSTEQIVYTDNSEETQAVTWDQSQVTTLNNAGPGTYVIDGTLSNGLTVKLTVVLKAYNFVANPGFENGLDQWNVVYQTKDANYVDMNTTDVTSGSKALHYWSANPLNFVVKQTITGLGDGTYELSAEAQGGVTSSSQLTLFAQSGTTNNAQNFTLSGWRNWVQPKLDVTVHGGSVTIGVSIQAPAQSWGSIDDFSLTKVSH